jgi:hypothetical protein
MSTKNVNRIKAVYDLATPHEITIGRAWYPQAYETARIMASDYGLCVQTVVGVIAALSPRNRWERNLLDSENLIEAYCVDRDAAAAVKVCTFGKNKAKAIKILDLDQDPFTDAIMDVLSGPKLREFAASILGLDSVCIDGHAFCIWNGARTSLKDVPSIGVRLRAEIISDYRKAAAKLGLTPTECQAVTWCAWRRIQGVTT